MPVPEGGARKWKRWKKLFALALACMSARLAHPASTGVWNIGGTSAGSSQLPTLTSVESPSRTAYMSSPMYLDDSRCGSVNVESQGV